MFGSDDDADFLAVNGSKLASLFVGTQAVEESNATFTYAAPRQPKKGILKEVQSWKEANSKTVSSSATNVPKLSIIIVKAVHTFLLEDGKYNPQGKLGAALLGNPEIQVYQLLLYKGKQNHVTSTPITSDFQFTVQSNNYSTFYTDQKQNWSLHFETTADGEEFARQVCLARANCVPGCVGIQSLLTQDLSLPEDSRDPAASVGDTIDVFYTVKTYACGSLGHLVETNCDAAKPQRVKIRDHVWEQGLAGVTRGGKRMILLPPHMAGPWKSAVSDGTSLAVEVEPIRLKQAKVSVLGPPVALPKVSPVALTESADSSTDEQSIRARGAHISQALASSPRAHKAHIISRMARMGQATLPLKVAPSDSEDTGDELMAPSAQPKSRAKPRSSLSQPGLSEPQPVAIFQPTWQPQQQQYSMRQFQSEGGDGHYQAPPGVYSTPSSTQMVYSSPSSTQMVYSAPSSTQMVYPAPSPSAITSPTSDISVFLSESRMHNTEVRMAVTKVADKVDVLLSKFESQGSRPHLSGPLLDPASLLAGVQRMVSENESLQSELADKRSKLDHQNERIFQLLNSNHKYLEQSSSSELEATVSALRQEKAKLSAALEEANGNDSLLKKLKSELEEMKSSHVQQESLVAKLKTKLTDAQEVNDNALASLIDKQKVEIEDMKSSKIQLESVISDLTSQLTDAQEVNANKSKDNALVNKQQAELEDMKSSKTRCEAIIAELTSKLTEAQEVNANKTKDSSEVINLASLVDKQKVEIEDMKRSKIQLESVISDLMSKLTATQKANTNKTKNSSEVINLASLVDKQKVEIEDMKRSKIQLESVISDLTSKLTAAQEANGVTMSARDRLEASEARSVSEVKRVMNAVWKTLNAKFDPGSSYEGDRVRQTLIMTIRDVTMQFLEMKGEEEERSQKVASNAINSEVKQSEATVKGVPESFDKAEQVVDSSVEFKVKESFVEAEEVEEAKVTAAPGSFVSEGEQVEEVKIKEAPVEAERGETKVTETPVAVPKSREDETEGWRPQPPPPPLFDDDEDDDDWLA